MKEADENWTFLYDFYESDESIVDVINETVNININKKLRNTTYDEFLADLTSLLRIDKDDITYEDFLYSIVPETVRCKINDIDNLENKFIEYFYKEILKNTNDFLPFSVKSKTKIFEGSYFELAYLILDSIGIKCDWFMYGGESLLYFVDKEEDLLNITKKIQQAYTRSKRWYRKLKGNYRNSPKYNISLYPLLLLLIVLRREWLYSNKKEYKYISRKLESLKSDSFKSIIYAIYDEFDQGDEKLKEEYNSEKSVKFHPLIAKHIIENKTYEILFEYCANDNLDISFNTIENNLNPYVYIEKILDKKIQYNASRLLLDYKFPYTKIRKRDAYINPDTISRIYLSLKIGSDYTSYCYENVDKDKKFDYIQIKPDLDTSGGYSYIRLMSYHNQLKSYGDFLILKSKEEYQKDEILKSAFSDFRHDLKSVIMISKNTICNLKYSLSLKKDFMKRLKNLFNKIKCFLNSSENDVFEDLRSLLKDLDMDTELRKYFPEMSVLIAEIRDVVEDLEYKDREKGIESLLLLSDKIPLMLNNMYMKDIDSYINMTNSIEENIALTNSYIELAGDNHIERPKEKFDLIKYVERLEKESSKILANCKFSIESDIDECIINYNKALLTVIINSIVDNASKHGFEGNTECNDPEIHFVIEEQKDFVVLKICNNGKPMDVTIARYRTRGVFSGITGHTGLGGYQICKYAEQMGGYVEIPERNNREWETEINLYIKK